MYKICTKCGLSKSIDQYGRFFRSPDGLKNWCKDCCSSYHRVHYQKNKLKKDSQHRAYCNANKEDRKKYDKQYSLTHKQHKAEYRRLRLATDPLFKLKSKLRTLIRNSLVRGGYTSKSQTSKLLGCSYECAKNWLEYTWFLNYGTEYCGQEVEIDHVIPNGYACSVEDCLLLQRITNLQYLTPEDNGRKLARYRV